MLIRPATSDDCSDLASLVSLFNGNATSPQQIQNRLQAMQSTEQVIVAEIANAVVGFGSLRLVYNFSDDLLYAELTDLFVHPDFRRQQVAQNLLSFIEQICKDRHVPQLVLITGFDNTGAQAFYHSIGFQDWALAMKKQLF